MIALYILLGLLIFTLLILCLRVNLHIIYENDLNVYLRVLFIKYAIFPEKEKKFNEKKYGKKMAKKKKSQEPVIKEKSDSDLKPSLLDKITYIKELLSVFLKSFSRHLRVNLKWLKIKIASDDAAKTAIMYGAVSGVVASILELIDSYTNLKALKEGTVSVEPDFTSEKCEASINISLSVSGFGALLTLAKTLWKSILLKNKQ